MPSSPITLPTPKQINDRVWFIDNGGHFNHEETRKEAVRVMHLSIVATLGLFIYGLYRIGSPAVKEASVDSEPEASFYAREIAFVVFSLMIPPCGYYGAKNKNFTLLRLFCLATGCCGFLAALVAGLAGGIFCSSLGNETCNGFAVTAILIYVVASVAYLTASYYSSNILEFEEDDEEDYRRSRDIEANQGIKVPEFDSL